MTKTRHCLKVLTLKRLLKREVRVIVVKQLCPAQENICNKSKNLALRTPESNMEAVACSLLLAFQPNPKRPLIPWCFFPPLQSRHSKQSGQRGDFPENLWKGTLVEGILGVVSSSMHGCVNGSLSQKLVKQIEHFDCGMASDEKIVCSGRHLN